MSVPATRTMGDGMAAGQLGAAQVVRYLYPDGQPFAPNFDFVTALAGFVDMAVRTLRRHRDAQDLLAQNVASREALRTRLDAAQQFADAVLSAAKRVAHSPEGASFLPERVQVLQDDLAGLVETTCEDLRGEVARECGRRTRQLTTVRQDVLIQIRRFFLDHELEVTAQKFVVALGPEGYHASAAQHLAGDISVAYELDAAQLGWRGPRRLGELLAETCPPPPGGRSSGWLRRGLRARARSIRDLIISHVELAHDGARIGLRKRRDCEDSLTLKLMKRDGEITAMLIGKEHPDRMQVVGDDALPRFSQLWRTLWDNLHAAPTVRRAVTRVSIEDGETLEAEDAPKLIERFVELYAPTVAQLLERGRSSWELSLLRELSNGEREEVYVCREGLSEQILSLLPEDRGALEHLGLAEEGDGQTGPRVTGVVPRLAPPDYAQGS